MAIVYFEIDTSGGGAEIKTGNITTDGSGVATVAFNTALSDTNYAVNLTAIAGSDTVTPMWESKASSGFSIRTEDDKGMPEPNADVDWIVTPYNNS